MTTANIGQPGNAGGGTLMVACQRLVVIPGGRLSARGGQQSGIITIGTTPNGTGGGGGGGGGGCAVLICGHATDVAPNVVGGAGDILDTPGHNASAGSDGLAFVLME